MEDDFFREQTSSSEVKAKIIAEYFPQYCRILLKKPRHTIRYMDLFAGPGKYDDNKHSTPLLLAKECAEDPLLCSKVHLIFNDKKYSEDLKKNFLELFPIGTFSNEPRFANKTVGEDEDINAFLNKPAEKTNPKPTLLFFDPFGYKGIDTLTLSKFLQNWGNELFLFVNIKRINQAIAVNKFDEMMQSLFPSTIDQLRKDRQYTASVQSRLNLIMTNLANEFVNAVGTKLYTCSFKFQEEDSNATSHFIIHFTKNQRGYELVKKVYNTYDNIGATLEKEGCYSYDAKRKAINSGLDFGNDNIVVLSKQLSEEFLGKRITAKALYEEHQEKTLFSWSHYLETLRSMVEKGKVKATFTDNVNHKVSVLITDTCILDF